jgi:hypothetical protein
MLPSVYVLCEGKHPLLARDMSECLVSCFYPPKCHEGVRGSKGIVPLILTIQSSCKYKEGVKYKLEC